MQVAKEILNQLGGNRFIAMTGSRNFGCTENSLSFHIGKNPSGYTHAKIELNVMDTYDVAFYKIRKYAIADEVTIPGVYCDNLVAVFESNTKLRTSL